MNLYTQKAITVEAWQITGEPELDREIDAWLRQELTWFDADSWQWPEYGFCWDASGFWTIMTERRMMQAVVGDWIIKLGDKDWQIYTDSEFRARFNQVLNRQERTNHANLP